MSNDEHDDAGGEPARKLRRSRSRRTDGAIDIREAQVWCLAITAQRLPLMRCRQLRDEHHTER
jgi:hypothetical protein